MTKRFSQLKFKIMALAALVIALAVAVFVWQKEIKQFGFDQFYAAEVAEANAEQQQQAKLLRDIIEVQKHALAQNLEERQKLAASYDALRGRGDGRDGPVAPVLAETIEGLRALQRTQHALH